MKIGKKIKEARLQLNLSQTDLAKKCGWYTESGRVRINNYEADKRIPRPKDIEVIATALNKPKAWFYDWESENTNFAIPVIEWRDLKGYEGSAKINSKPLEIYTPEVFGLKVENDSMDSTSGVSFPPGCIILIQPFAKYESEDYVIVQLDQNSFVFRQIILEGNERYLRALNPGWKPINLSDKTNIIGVVVSSIMKFK